MDIYLSNWKSPNKKGVDTNTQNARAIPDERKEWLDYNIINKKGKNGKMETIKQKRNEPDPELKRIANSSIEDLEKEVKIDQNKL